jgi:type VI secretion system secreted protein VgrG
MADDTPQVRIDDDSAISNADQQANRSFLPTSLGKTIEGCPVQAVASVVICPLMCACKIVSAAQWCVSLALWRLDDKSESKSPLKAEVPYDMTTTPPQPYMSKNNPKRATRRRPLESKIPDVVVVKDGSKPPTQDNIVEVVELKFPGDTLKPEQERAYLKIAGRAPFTVLTLEKCGCPEIDKKVSHAVTAVVVLSVVAEIAALIFAPEVGVPALAAF